MKKLIIIFISCFFLTGCSFLPKLTFDSKGAVPQQIDKSKLKETCRGEAEFNKYGDMISCSKGYYNYQEGYEKKERKYTFTEKIKNFINSLLGWGFWGFVLIIILVPGLAGTLLGRLIEGTVGITGRALRSVVRGVQTTRKQGKNIDDSLASEQDNDVKLYIRRLKEKENIK